MALDAILTVAGLAAGASVVVPHTLQLEGADLTPNFVAPDRATPIRVASVTSTTVTFTNDGNGTESAFFHAKKDHSVQQAGTTNLYWQGSAGFSSFKLIDTQWDDLLVPLIGINSFGANPPNLVRVAGDGAVVPGSALVFNGTGGGGGSTASIPDFGDFTLSYSVQIWVNSAWAGAAKDIIAKNNTFTMWLQSGGLRVQLQGMAAQLVPGFLLGAKNHIVLVVTKVAAAVTGVQVYVNGTLATSVTLPDALAADNANVFTVMQSNHAGTVDEIRFYQAALTGAQVSELYALGAGTEAEPAGAPTLLAGYHCNEGAGNTIDNYEGTAARDGTLANVTWTAGLVGAAGSTGVFAWQFLNGVKQDLQWSMQLRHAYKEGTNPQVHVHWTAPVLAAGDIVLGVEVQSANIGEVWPATTTVYTVVATPNAHAANTHKVTTVIDLPGVGFGLSRIIRGNVFRLGTGLDTFPLPIIIDNVDAHIELDTLGSREEFVK